MFNQNQGLTMRKQTIEELLRFTEGEVDSLLGAYKEYKALSLQIKQGVAPKSTTKFSLMGNMGKMQNLDPLAEAKKKLEAIGEGMKFQNPLIWLLYKHLAYKNDPSKAIRTLGDLVSHCREDGICHKRFDSINSYFRRNNDEKDMTSEEFMGQSLGLENVSQDPRYISMCLDQEFQATWSENENDKSGKWRNYSLT